MRNPNMTVKERNLLKGAIRRVFSRSDLRRAVIASARVEGYHDPNRPRVKKWSRCTACQQMSPEYLMDCDHIDPIVPINQALEDMSWDTVVDRAWCARNNLQPVCKPCHKEKTKAEGKLRREAKKKAKGNI